MGRDGPEKRCRIDERKYYGADESKICRNPAKNCPKPPENGDLSLLLSLQFNDNKEDMFREICVQEGGCHFMMAITKRDAWRELRKTYLGASRPFPIPSPDRSSTGADRGQSMERTHGLR